MLSIRLTLAVTLCFMIAAAQNAPTLPDPDYLDDIKEYGQHYTDEAAHKYMEQINKMDMLDVDDYPDDDDDDEDYDEDEDDEDEDEDDDDDGEGGCGDGSDDDDDDDDDEDEEDLSPVEQVIETYFTR
ncbi:uncharacterized protein [Macrobrachium rosenbergii]|uniref:uncharacterized protein n=1 Tax=Macrobrachium rosenbergii TaxID=79674 RepID=UPI0034D59647